MTPLELAGEFLSNPTKMEKYGRAISLLREAGFETVLRRLGEPTMYALDAPNHLDISAFEHAEKRGWFQALDFLFDFDTSLAGEAQSSGTADYGAKERLRNLGFSSEIVNAIDEEGDING